MLAAAIFTASSTNQVSTPDFRASDKLIHFLAFGFLATLVARNGFVPRYGWLAVLIVSAYGASDEWHQYYTPGRHSDFLDWVADTSGAALAVFLYARWGWYRGLLEASMKPKQRRVENPPPVASNAPADEPR